MKVTVTAISYKNYNFSQLAKVIETLKYCKRCFFKSKMLTGFQKLEKLYLVACLNICSIIYEKCDSYRVASVDRSNALLNQFIGVARIFWVGVRVGLGFQIHANVDYTKWALRQ